MRLLLDTHVWLWMTTGDQRLGQRTRTLLREPESDLYLSAASVWEIGIKYASGKLRYVGDPAVLVPQHVRRTGVITLSISTDHALAAAALPMHHRDPFDRLIVAQAQAEDLTVATVDRRIAAYGVQTLDASE